MARKRLRLTAALQQTITAYIRAGGYPQVAAAAAGVPRGVFQHWLHLGQQDNARPLYRQFDEAVLQAGAQARLGAELAVLKSRPLDWLKGGPGKETTDSPGWTANVKAPTVGETQVNPLLSPEMQQLFTTFLEVLTPFPEARAAVAQTLAENTP